MSLASLRCWEGQCVCSIASRTTRLKLEAEGGSSWNGSGQGFETGIRIDNFILTSVRCSDMVHALRQSPLLFRRWGIKEVRSLPWSRRESYGRLEAGERVWWWNSQALSIDEVRRGMGVARMTSDFLAWALGDLGAFEKDCVFEQFWVHSQIEGKVQRYRPPHHSQPPLLSTSTSRVMYLLQLMNLHWVASLPPKVHSFY